MIGIADRAWLMRSVVKNHHQQPLLMFYVSTYYAPPPIHRTVNTIR